MDTRTCKDCGAAITQASEKALDGTYAVVWTDWDGAWICEPTGNEHVPDAPNSVYQRDLDAHTAGLSATDMLDDEVFNIVVDGMENVGHSRARVERDLRSWIEDDVDIMNPVEALTYAILAINTAEAPDATSAADYVYLDAASERAITALAALRSKLEREER